MPISLGSFLSLSLSLSEFFAFATVPRAVAEQLVDLPARMKAFRRWLRRGGCLQWFGEVSPDRFTGSGQMTESESGGMGREG